MFRQWKPDTTGFETALHDYLDNLKVDNKWTGNEGRVQDFWSHLEEGPWTPFDREAAVHYGTKEAAAQGAQFTDVQRARSILEEIARARPNRDGKPWQEPSKASGRQQLDQLGIDKHGNLVLVELKDASSKSFSSVFYAPLQLLGYVHEWCAAFRWEHIRCQLNDLIDARKQLGLISPEVVPLTGGIRAAICFGKDKRSDEVKRRFYEALGVVNWHRPPGVQPFEAWSLAARDEAPQSL